ncbi:MAG: hypothetical protein FWG51_01390, partial [Firmicutes bacterium]|nr:hypothetical protein [Bacillota bacterium]
MKCYKCGVNEADVKIEIKQFGIKKELLLCDACAKQEGIFNDDYIDIDFIPFMGFNEYELPAEKICKVCNSKASEFLHTGYVGCKNCYAEFNDLILSFVKRFQGDSKHVGKN